MVLLTKKEIAEVATRIKGDTIWLSKTYLNPYLEAQLKKLVEWGNEDCDCGLDHKFDIERSVHRHFCPRCWQALLEEIE